MKEITSSSEASLALSGNFSLSSENLQVATPAFSEHQNHLSQILFHLPVQDLYQRLCHSKTEKRDWALSLLKEYAEISGAKAFVRFALGPHRDGFFYFDKAQDELIAYIKKEYEASVFFKRYAAAKALNLYYKGTDIRPFIQIIERMSSLKDLSFYFVHLPLLNHFRPEHVIFKEKFSPLDLICFSNDLTVKQMLDALTLFPNAKVVNVGASRQAFNALTQGDVQQLGTILSPRIEKLVIPHDVPASVLKTLVDVGLKDMIVDLERKKHYEDLKALELEEALARPL